VNACVVANFKIQYYFVNTYSTPFLGIELYYFH
jgi:hypothetical protein